MDEQTGGVCLLGQAAPYRLGQALGLPGGPNRQACSQTGRQTDPPHITAGRTTHTKVGRDTSMAGHIQTALYQTFWSPLLP